MADEPSEDVQAVLDRLAAADAPETHELEPAQAREQMAELFGDADPVEPVGDVRERTIPGPDGDVSVRVYTPQSDGPHPVVAFFHGGGFVLGDLDSHDAPCRLLTNAIDCVVVSVDYRLAPEQPFPAAVEDCYAVTDWLADHAGELGGDSGRLAVAGDSAGGNLAAAVALAARNSGGPDLAHQALVYPVADFRDGAYPSREENAEGYFLTAAEMAYFEDHYVQSWVHDANPYLNPIAARSHANLPPASVVTCGFDPLRDEGIAYVDALETDGTPVTHHHFDDLVHGVMNMVQEPTSVAGGRDVVDAVASDLRESLY